MTGDDFLETLQADVVAILKAVPSLADVNIIPEDDGDMEARITRILAALEGGSTAKPGCVAVVMLPEVADAERGLPGPPLTLELRVQVIEQHVINRASNGSGVRSSVGALRVLAALHHQSIGVHSLIAGKKPVEPVDVKKGYLSHMVSFVTEFRDLQGPGRVGPVTPSIAAGFITLASATSGAAIRYTTDGDYPDATHGTLYTAPFAAPAAGTLVRAAAYKAALNPSNCIEFTITD